MTVRFAQQCETIAESGETYFMQHVSRIVFCCRWFTLEAAAGILKPNSMDYLGGRNLSQYLFDTAMASNISVIRFIGGSANDADEFKLQTAPGMVYIFTF